MLVSQKLGCKTCVTFIICNIVFLFLSNSVRSRNRIFFILYIGKIYLGYLAANCHINRKRARKILMQE